MIDGVYDRAFQPDGCLGHSENMLKPRPSYAAPT